MKSSEQSGRLWYFIGTMIIFITILLVMLFDTFPSEAFAETMYVSVSEGSWLNGRAEPDKHAFAEYKFHNGDEVEVLEIVDGWAKVDEGGEAQYSYVSVDYLTECPGEEKRMRVSSDGRVRVRETPDGDVIGYARDGDEVSVSLSFNGWAKTNKGWIRSEYLEN